MTNKSKQEANIRAETIAASSEPQAIHYRSGGAVFNKAYVDMIEAEAKDSINQQVLEALKKVKSHKHNVHAGFGVCVPLSTIEQIMEEYK